MSNRPKRKAIPMGVKLEACLRLLGFKPGDRIEWHHTPALGLRPVNADGTDYDPPQLDPNHIEPLGYQDHKVQTNGRKGESDLSIDSNSDKARIAKVKRIEASRIIASLEAGMDADPKVLKLREHNKKARAQRREEKRSAVSEPLMRALDILLPKDKSLDVLRPRGERYKAIEDSGAVADEKLKTLKKSLAKKSQWPQGRKLQGRPFSKRSK